MVVESSCICLESQFYEVNISNGQTTKHVIWNPKFAIFSSQTDNHLSL
jgi:hypothetical protein